MRSLWKNRSNDTGLLGNEIHVMSEQWISKVHGLLSCRLSMIENLNNLILQVAGLGAGIDSFYEYLLKSHILFDEEEDLSRFVELYKSIRVMRRGRTHCNSGDGLHPIYVNVDMATGDTANNWIDSLQAAFPALQVGKLSGSEKQNRWNRNI